jgi:hypothetical protein
MNPNQIFEQMLKDPILIQKYGLMPGRIAELFLSSPSASDIIEVIKSIVNGVEHDSPDSSIYSMISTQFGI